MWPWQNIVAVVSLLAVVAIHLYWRRRSARMCRTCERQAGALRAFEEKYEHLASQIQAQQHALFNSMVEGVLVLDRQNRVQLVNQSLEKLFALKADVRGRSILEAFRLHELDELVRNLTRQRRISGQEIELPGMEERRVEINAAAVYDRDGAQNGAILVFHDLTRIKQLENTRQEFVANVSHELRTPLSLIKGFVETLLEGAKDDAETTTRFLQTIEKHTDRLTYLIEDLLTISRLESGQLVMNLHPVELRAEVQRVVDDLQTRAADRGTSLRNETPEGLEVRADADRLQQVLFNLVENAIKYGRPQGRTVIGGRPRDESMAEVWVRDDGPGIPAEARERIFERFFRVDRARSRDTGGTGLGLSIVKHIVQAHGGEVWVRSEPGEGTALHFTLPRR
jgi:two-component system phosphate regulon sensor histidine kinase PhoR